MKRDDKEKGFTLIELVVVIAISAFLLVAIGLTINVVFSNKTKSASKNIYNMLGAAQTLGMSKNNIYLKLSADDKGNCSVGIVSGNGTEAKEVETKSLGTNLDLKIKVGNTMYAISANTVYYISIDRKTGGFKGTYTSTAQGASSLGNCSDIMLAGGTYDIALVALTGKFYYK